jgi:hypothetical protein
MKYLTKCNLWMWGTVLVALLAGLAVILIMAPQGPVGDGIAFTKAFAIAAVVILTIVALGTAIGLRLTRRWLLAESRPSALVEQLERTIDFLAHTNDLLRKGDMAGLRDYLTARQAASLDGAPSA